MSESSAAPGTAPLPWSLPAIKGPVVSARDGSRRPSDIEDGAREAWQAGFESGRREGLAAAEQVAIARLRDLDKLLESVRHMLLAMARPLEELDEQAARELARLALGVGAQLARRDLRIDPAQVIAIIRECVGQLPAAARHVRVHLHPQDAAAVRECLADPAGERAWSIVEDPVAGRGGCRVVTDVSQIDARFESRLATAIATVLGDERAQQREGDELAAGGGAADSTAGGPA